MLIDIVLLITGLALIVWGADFLVDGASAAARKAGVSEFVIGLTIVGMGTSAPEMVVSLIGAFEGNADVAVGNVMGSNIFNTLMILGLTALILPIGITPLNRRKDIPANIAATVLMLLIGLRGTILGLGNDTLGRAGGAVFLVLFGLYLFSCFKFDSKEASQPGEKPVGTFKAILMILGGLVGLVAGGRLFVDNATALAKLMGVSDKFIAVTILAGGTSLPELATCVVAAAKKKGQLALGNIIGSNIFNILLILGTSAVVTPLSFGGIDLVDAGTLFISSVVLLLSAFTFGKDRVDRGEGALLLALWVAYMTWLIINV